MKVKTPKATHQGKLNVANATINCAVLEDGTRILSQADFLRSIGRSRSPKAKHGVTVAEIPTFLSAKNLKPFINKEIIESTKPIKYRDIKGRVSYGYKAESLPKVCEVFLKARDKKAIKHVQSHIEGVAIQPFVG